MTNNTDLNNSDLLKEFRKLKTVSQKLKFWKERLSRNYIDFLLRSENVIDRHNGFEIIPDKKEWEIFNKWIIQNFPDKHELVPPHVRVIRLPELKSDYKSRLKLTMDRRKITIEEIKNIEYSFESPTAVNKNYPSDFRFSFEFYANYKVFKDYLRFKNDPDYSQYIPKISIIQIANGKTLAEFYMYLESELKQYPTIVSNQETSPLTVKQLALLLHYTEILSSLNYDTSLKSRIFSSLLRVNNKNLYDAIRNVENPKAKNEDDLKAVITFLNNNNLTKFTSLPIEALEKLS